MRIGLLVVLLAPIAQLALAASPQDFTDCTTKFEQEAVLACTRVIEDKSTPPDTLALALFNRGLGYEGTGAFNEAIADFNETIRLAPKEDSGYLGRGKVYQDIQDFEHSIADFSEAIRLKPKAPSVIIGAASATTTAATTLTRSKISTRRCASTPTT